MTATPPSTAATEATTNPPRRKALLRVDDFETARSVARSPDFATLDLAAYLRALQAQTGRDFAVLIQLAENTPFFMQGPRHLRMRRVLTTFMGPARVEAWRPTLAQLIDQALDRLEAAPEPDLVRDFAEPLYRSAAGALLGVEGTESPAFLGCIGQTRTLLEPMLSLREIATLQKAVAELVAVVAGSEPWRLPGRPQPLYAHLMENLDGDLDRDAAVALVAVCFVAAQTTSQTLSNAVLAVLRSTAGLRSQAGDPAWIEAHIDNLLRLNVSTQSIDRIAARSADVRDLHFEAGDRVHVQLAAVNRDEAVFPGGAPGCPFHTGEARMPDHMGFSTGVHRCPGALFARLMIGMALPALFSRFPAVSLTVDEPQWYSTELIRMPLALPCRLHPYF
ncbi:cytochrome P450 [Xylophilus sp. GOD-11R]|uniref:cytochrome P450 n=1 Tax=Xylophilus sp. GOD-11R TaxID=3089814 RepID=UPI00298D390B|nr:cytochrome P450 [Xylophilus sp. GOD-11R]WPB58999.1 cytochrome P450 [Xylophilus sp. GOD-11R]